MRSYPQCLNQARASLAVMTESMAVAMASSRAAWVRAFVARSHHFNFDHASSIGLRSGEIGWLEDEMRAHGLDELADARVLVGREVVHDDGIPRQEFGEQHLLDVGGEDPRQLSSICSSGASWSRAGVMTKSTSPRPASRALP